MDRKRNAHLTKEEVDTEVYLQDYLDGMKIEDAYTLLRECGYQAHQLVSGGFQPFAISDKGVVSFDVRYVASETNQPTWKQQVFVIGNTVRAR